MLAQGALSCVADLLELDLGHPEARKAVTKFANIVKLASKEVAAAQNSLEEGLRKTRESIVRLESASPPGTTGAEPVRADQISLTIDFEEWAVLDNALEAARQGILKKTALTKQALTRAEHDVAVRIEDVRDTCRAQAIGVDQDSS